jgi:transglutaminase-like putative cysteine protease
MVTARVGDEEGAASRMPRMPVPVQQDDELVDHRSVDWTRVRGSRFLVRQRTTYVYDRPISQLHHRLMVVPPDRHGDQVRLAHGVEARGAVTVVDEGEDAFGNHVIDVEAAFVDERVEFETWAVAERRKGGDPTRLGADSLHDRRLLQPSPLTWPDDALEDAAHRLAASGDTGVDLARRINTWVYRLMRYRPDVTSIDTTAARAFGMAQGVCQDYAHVMLCLCRLCGLPARYVSGQLLGEGGSHAWVEVVVPDTADAADAAGVGRDGNGGAVAVPFDPTHGREVGMSYLTIAVGREYSDVAPTYGTYSGDGRGRLSIVKRVGVTWVDSRSPTAAGQAAG